MTTTTKKDPTTLKMDQFIARDDEVDGTECSRRVRSPAVMREHVKSTYLTDVIRRWDLESDGYTTEHGSVRRHCFIRAPLFMCVVREIPPICNARLRIRAFHRY